MYNSLSLQKEFAKMADHGRPSKLTPERSSAILISISKRVPYAIAAPANGVHEDTLYEWISRGLRDIKEGIDSEYSRFSESLKKIEQEKIIHHIDKINENVDRWQADAWILERRWWKHFSPNGALRELANDVDKMKTSTNKTDFKSIDTKIDSIKTNQK